MSEPAGEREQGEPQASEQGAAEWSAGAQSAKGRDVAEPTKREWGRLGNWSWGLLAVALVIGWIALIRWSGPSSTDRRALEAVMALDAVRGQGDLHVIVRRQSWQPTFLSTVELRLGWTRAYESTLETVDFEARGLAVDDERLRLIARLRSLEGLALRDARISDGALAELQSLAKLRVVNFAGTPITDAGLVHLARMGHLTSIDLSRTRVTAAGVSRLKAALPGCRITAP